MQTESKVFPEVNIQNFLLLIDEWAADQDPLFKEIFYVQFLSELKNRGKAVLVITHDDRYFDLADRVIRLDYGQISVRN